MSLIDKHLLTLIMVSSGYLAGLLFIFRHRIAFWGDPFVINLTFLSGALSFVGLAFYIDSKEGYWLVFGVHLFLLGMLFGLRWTRVQFVGPHFAHALAGFRTKPGLLFLFALVFAIVVGNLVLNILSGEYRMGFDDPSQRYKAVERSRLLFHLWFGVTNLVPFFVYLFRATLLRFLAICLLIVSLTIGILFGGKGAVLLFIRDVLFIFYLGIIDGARARPRPSILLAAVIPLGFGLTLVMIQFLMRLESMGEALVAFVIRVFGHFDQLISASVLEFPLKDYGLSMWKFYFATALKALGWYDGIYNGANHFFIVNALGFEIDQVGTAPTNNLLIEVIFTQGLLAGMILVPIWSIIVFRVWDYFLGNRYRSVFSTIFFVHFTLSPFGFFYDGQMFFTRSYSLLLVYLVWLGAVNIVKFAKYGSSARMEW